MPSAAFVSTDYAMHHDPPVPNGCTWMRCVLPGRALSGMGWSVALGLPRDHPELGIGVAHEEGALFGFDVYVYKLLLHQSTPEEFAKMRTRGDRVVVDVDDFHFGISDSNIAARATSPLHSPDNNRMWHEMSMRVADRVTVSTDFLASHYERRCRDVVVVRNSLDTDRYEPVNHPESPVLGWVGGTPWRSGDIETLRSWLPRFVDDYDLRVHHAGHIPGDPRHFAARAGLRRVTTTLNCDMDGYPSLLSGFHIGLVPLTANPFNEAKCLYPGTMICTNRGMIRADRIMVGDFVWTQARQWRAVEAVETTPTRPGLSIRTASGRRIKVTPEHRLWCNGGWVQASEIREGDTLESVPMQSSPLGYVRVPWPTQSRRTRSGEWADYANAPDVATVEVTERWGRILGIFAGDGACVGKSQITISCDGQDQDLISMIMDDFRAIGLTPTTEAVCTFDGVELRRRSVRVASAHLSKVLVDIGVAEWRKGSSTAKRVVNVPDVVFRSPRSVIAAFLSGLFEADGTATGTTVSMTTVYEDFALQVQALLAMLGMQSSVRFRKTTYVHEGVKKQGRGAYKVVLRRAAADLFVEEVGFLSSRKRARLQEIVGRPHSNAYRKMSWDERVESIEPCEIESPIDIQVDGEEFIAEGLRSHNSYLKGLEYAAAGIPFIASPTEEYRILHAAGIGRLASTPDEWRDHATELLDRGVRVAEAERQRALVRERFDSSTMGEAWATALLG